MAANGAVLRRVVPRAVFVLVALVSLIGMHGLNPWTLPSGPDLTAAAPVAPSAQPAMAAPAASSGVGSHATPGGSPAHAAVPATRTTDGCGCPLPAGPGPTHSGHLAGMCAADDAGGGQAAPCPIGLVALGRLAQPPPRAALPGARTAAVHRPATSLADLRILRI